MESKTCNYSTNIWCHIVEIFQKNKTLIKYLPWNSCIKWTYTTKQNGFGVFWNQHEFILFKWPWNCSQSVHTLFKLLALLFTKSHKQSNPSNNHLLSCVLELESFVSYHKVMNHFEELFLKFCMIITTLSILISFKREATIVGSKNINFTFW